MFHGIGKQIAQHLHPTASICPERNIRTRIQYKLYIFRHPQLHHTMHILHRGREIDVGIGKSHHPRLYFGYIQHIVYQTKQQFIICLYQTDIGIPQFRICLNGKQIGETDYRIQRSTDFVGHIPTACLSLHNA